MSGRKQHYIPQFLLRSFAEPGKGKKEQVRVITRDRSFIAATAGVAAEREFYSKLGENQETLDDRITDAETEYASIYHRLRACAANEVVPPLDVARLLAHLTIRGGHMRNAVSTFGQRATLQALEFMSDGTHLKKRLGLRLPEPNQEMRERLDKIYNDKKADLSRAKISRHEFRKRAFEHLKAHWDESLQTTVPHLLSRAASTDFPQIASDSHKKALAESLEPQVRVDSLAKLEWRIREWKSPTLVLPDSVAIAHFESVGAAPLAFVGTDELNAALFPLSPTKAVCAGTYSSPAVLDALTANFPLFAAAASWNFVVSPPSLKFDGSLGSAIGTAVVRMMSTALEDALAETIAAASE